MNPIRLDPQLDLTPDSSALTNGPVIFWMSRDQRVQDNWAFWFAQSLQRPVVVVFVLLADYPHRSERLFRFMIEGLQQVELKLKALQIPFVVERGKPAEVIPRIASELNASAVVTDFSPLRGPRASKKAVQKALQTAGKIPMFSVDAHNIIPVWHASPKKEYAAYTLRPKIHRLLPDFLDDLPPKPSQNPQYAESTQKGSDSRTQARFKKLKDQSIDWQQLIQHLDLSKTPTRVEWIESGEQAASRMLHDFIKHRVQGYDINRNNPAISGQSNLSPYLHFGQISAQRVALEIHKSSAPQSSKDAFLEELIVRRELAENFCYYEPHYDSIESAPSWAKTTLEQHAKDDRPYLYTKKQLELAKTHDELWNAAQLEMIQTGKMHGYLRMYWAKKILEWTVSPQEAFRIAVELNDTYQLDGRDPNGYAGIAWSIAGVHDRPWFERSIFGTIRFMSRGGAEKKFDVPSYIQLQNNSQTIEQLQKTDEVTKNKTSKGML